MKPIVSLFLALLVVCSPGVAQWSPWTPQSTGLPTGYCMAWMYAVNDSIAWGVAVTNENTGAQYFSRTTDGGATWTTNTITGAPANFGADYVYAVDATRARITMFNPTPGPSRVSGALLSTTDGGTTWLKDSAAFSSTGGAPDFVYFFDANTGVAVGDPDSYGYFEIYRTSNGGANWSRVPKANIPSPLGAEYAVAGEFSAAGDCLWFPTFTLNGQARYLMTTDKGLTWSANVFPNISTKWGWHTVLEFQDDSVGLGQGSQDGVMKTTDGGLTWGLIPNTSWLSLRDLKYVQGTPGMYVGTSAFNGQSAPGEYVWGTVVTTDGGSTWTRIGQGATEFTDLSFGSSRVGWRTVWQKSYVEKFSISSGRLIGVSPDSVWYPLTGAGSTSDTVTVDIANYGTDPLQVTGIVPPGPNFTIIQQPSFPLTLTTLQSARLKLTFTPQAGGILEDSMLVLSNASNPAGSRIFLSGEGFAAKIADKYTLYVASAMLYRINADALTITKIDSLGTIPIQALTVDTSGSLYGVSARPGASTLYQIDCSTGATMLVKTFPVGYVSAIAFSPHNVLYGATTFGDFYRLNVATGAATYISSTEDVSFTSLAFNRNGRLLGSATAGTTYDNIFSIDTTTGEVALVGQSGGNAHVLSITFDPGGKLYGLTGTGADTNAIIAINPVSAVGTMLLSTGTTGLHAMAMNPYSTTGVQNQPPNGVPRVFALKQNYPNPFNPRTVVSSQLPVVSNVKLVIYDLLGREVAVLVNERRAPGYYQDTFDASGLASGVYIYRLTAGSFVQSRKMLLIK
jgi:photosystem II stability/assembly factor-like uncharacterized protein